MMMMMMMMMIKMPVIYFHLQNQLLKLEVTKKLIG